MRTIILATATASDTQTWIEPFERAMPWARLQAWPAAGAVPEASLAIVWNPPPDLLQRAPRLKALFNLGAGVDALLRLPGLHPQVDIFRLEDAGMAVQMAEYALYAFLRAARRFDAYAQLQQQECWKPLPAPERRQWPVGVLGLGRMGQRVARAIADLEYPVAGWSRRPRSVPNVECFAGMPALPEFLARTRVLINALPLTAQTQGLLNAQTLSCLQPGAHLIHVGRGGHLVEEDLPGLLDSGQLAGAVLDVFQQEPLPPGHPFWHDPRIVVTPHVAASTLVDEAVAQISDKIRRYLDGEMPAGRVPIDQEY